MAFKRLFSALLVAFAAVAWLCGAAAAESYRIVAFGDSLMAGYRLAPGESFPERLEAALRARGHDVVIVNAAVSGDTTSDGLSRLDWSVPDGTDLVMLELGANDMLRGMSPRIAEKNLDAMVARLKQRGIDVVLMGMRAAPNLGPDYEREFNAIYADLAGRYGLVLYPFFLEGVAANASLLLDDRMHPNPRGIDRMVEGVLPLIEQKLAAAQGGG